MKILWLTNIPLPEASLLMNEKPLPFGGWLVNTSTLLSSIENLELSVAFPKVGVNNVHFLKGDNICYYAFPPVNDKDISQIEANKYLEKVVREFKPDLVHIFGTEYPHTLAMVNICREKGIRAVISIQGLVSVIERHYMAFLPSKIQNRYTLRDFLKQDNIKQQQKKFHKRGKYEIEALQKVDYIIGRTTWDKACVTQINPNVRYYHCNETLREEFYKHTWDISNCERYSIFVSQGSYPIKGLHLMVEAMSLIVKKFPKTKLYVGGYNITQSDTLKEKLKLTYYGKFVKDLITKYDLQDKIVFTGLLDERQMCERYLKSHVFVCPSSIENSPNSLGEAMILGVPCVASDVGGISDLLKHREEGFVYQADAPYMLAHYVMEIFSNIDVALKFSKNARSRAKNTHDIEENTKGILEIYQSIFDL
jgi:glycosyltransferase involved in cell wall biosynthesis